MGDGSATDRTVDECGVCCGNGLEILWNLPNLPFTERFGTYSPDLVKGADQVLVICPLCGHVQLRNRINPGTLYDASYSFRTGQSGTATLGTAVFLEFLGRISEGRRFRSALDIGGNDQYLAQQLRSRAEELCVIDPVCSHLDGTVVEGVRIIGRFIENVDLSKDIEKPDLVVCRHTLEHIAEPGKVMAQILDQCHDDAMFVFEIPCIEGLSESLRFDAIFHQHLHYFDLSGLQRLVSGCGGRWLGHLYNHQGSCGGALLFAFAKSRQKSPKPSADAAVKAAYLRERICLFESQMGISAKLLETMPSPRFGYGASLMLATLAYHLKTDFSNLDSILDDDPGKHGLEYANLPVTVEHSRVVSIPENSSFVVTSLENTRSIFKRVAELKPRRILVPVSI